MTNDDQPATAMVRTTNVSKTSNAKSSCSTITHTGNDNLIKNIKNKGFPSSQRSTIAVDELG